MHVPLETSPQWVEQTTHVEAPGPIWVIFEAPGPKRVGKT